MAKRKSVQEKKEAVKQIRDGVPITQVAAEYEVTPQTIRNWMKRVEKDPGQGLEDRSGRPTRKQQEEQMSLEEEVLFLREELRKKDILLEAQKKIQSCLNRLSKTSRKPAGHSWKGS